MPPVLIRFSWPLFLTRRRLKIRLEKLEVSCRFFGWPLSIGYAILFVREGIKLRLGYAASFCFAVSFDLSLSDLLVERERER